MQLICDAKPVTVGLKMSVVQETLSITETLLNDPILHTLESNFSDADKCPEISSESSEKEQPTDEILGNNGKEITEAIDDEESKESEASILAEGGSDDKIDIPNLDNVDLSISTIDEINANTEPKSSILAESENVTAKTNGEILKKPMGENEILKSVDEEIEKVEEKVKELNGVTDDTNSEKDEVTANNSKKNPDNSELQPVEENSDSVVDEINKLIGDDFEGNVNNIDNSDIQEKSVENMEIDISNENIPDVERAKTDDETSVKDINEKVVHIESNCDVSNNSSEIEDVTVVEKVKNNIEIGHKVIHKEDDKDDNICTGSITSQVQLVQLLNNTTDIKDDPNLNSAVAHVNEDSSKKTTPEKTDSRAVTDSTVIIDDQSMNVDMNIDNIVNNTNTTTNNADQVTLEKEMNTSLTQNISEVVDEGNISKTQNVSTKKTVQGGLKVAKWASTGFFRNRDETPAPLVIDRMTLNETIDQPSCPSNEKLDFSNSINPTQDSLSKTEMHTNNSSFINELTPSEDKPALDKPPSPCEEISTKNKSDELKECVSLVDDDDNDDIMVIDEDSNAKCITLERAIEVSNIPEEKVEPSRRSSNDDKIISDNDDDVVISTNVPNIESLKTKQEKGFELAANNASESKSNDIKDDKLLVPLNFLDSFKTKMGEMTRADLEELCLLKIVEGVADRSNLSDIKAKLKTMMQNVEEWRKKIMVLNKQNRDLQIVLRTVQEEQKKKSDEVITPLKITRSVGMQVLMTENKSDTANRARGQKRVSNQLSNTQQKNSGKVMTQATKMLKTPIPVPRLVPAQSNSPTKPVNTKQSPQVQNSTVTSNSGGGKAITPNGVKTNTQTRAAEKRSFSVSIDLTDDELPPAKQIAVAAKGVQNQVKPVPSQKLLAPTRATIGNHNNQKSSNPQQVYIPIGMPQGNIRAGQTLLFKNSTNVRARQPTPGTIVRPGQSNVRPGVPRNQNRHPAPLPQAYCQPQPPNWKALPPAPDLKISKIENGIVVSWKIDEYQEDAYEEIVSYQLYAYQETNAPASTFLWNKIGDIKALPLPMACTLTQFIAGYKYYFAVRAVDIRSRIGPFSLPGSILLLNK